MHEPSLLAWQLEAVPQRPDELTKLVLTSALALPKYFSALYWNPIIINMPFDVYTTEEAGVPNHEAIYIETSPAATRTSERGHVSNISLGIYLKA